MKKPKVKTLKAKLWKIFSQYIRLRDANEDGYVSCVSCGNFGFWKGESMQAGHYLAGRGNGILFDERCVHGQCSTCNMLPDGEVGSDYKTFMLNKYGQSVIDELKRQKKNPPKLDISWYEEKIIHYENLVSRIKSEKGL